jgi:hypothetical protein
MLEMLGEETVSLKKVVVSFNHFQPVDKTAENKKIDL